MTRERRVGGESDYGTPRLVVELTNTCNLHCSYCLRDEDALYNSRAKFFPPALLARIATEARDAVGVTHVAFTGGEATIHPQFSELIELLGDLGLGVSFVTNGWHFDRVWPAVKRNRHVITHVSFSLDGATREEHDRWRGDGSFVRLVRAISRCRMGGVPFLLKVGLRRDTLPGLESIALFAARMGAAGLSFSHLLPTSGDLERDLGLGPHERRRAEEEIAVLANIFKMPVRLDVGYFNLDPAPPCTALAGTTYNVDYRGRLSLCCNLSGYRGAAGESDVAGDLNVESFGVAHGRLRQIANEQLERRRDALRQAAAGGRDSEAASPCKLCLRDFGKLPWRGAEGLSRELPVLPVA